MSKRLRLATYQPDIAPNLGTMIRLCACMDVGIDVIEPCGFPFSVKSLRRAAMDYAEIADITRHASWDSFHSQHEGRIVLLSTKSQIPLWDFRFWPNDTIMVGRETAGVPDSVFNAVSATIRIPMPGGGRSLNVALSAAMALGEAMRQIRHPSG